MRVSPIIGLNHNVSNQGRVGKSTADLTRTMSSNWLDAAGKYKELPIINTCLYASEKVNDIFLNLSTLMERFGHAAELTYEKSLKSGKYRFFIENKHSNYKTICADIEFSEKLNQYSDINKLQMLENKVAKLNPYKENSNFIIQRKSVAKDIIYDKEFEPDKDYIFVEDKLIHKQTSEATMADIEEFIEVAKKEGLING